MPNRAVASLVASLVALSQNPQRELQQAVARTPRRPAPQQHNRLDRLYEKDLQDEDPERAAAYGVMKDLWREVGGYFPNAKEMPGASFWPNFPHPAWNGENVLWGKRAAQGLARGGLPISDEYKQALLHEWAHAHQRPGLSPDDAEGGAEAFASALIERTARRAGRRFDPGNLRASPYYDRVAAAALNRGPDWILREQFGV